MPISIEFSLYNQIAFLLYYDLLFLVLIIFFISILLKFEQKLFGFLQLLPSVCFALLFILTMGLFLHFLLFFLVKLFASVLRPKHSLQIGTALILVKYDCCVSLSAVMIVMYFVSVLVWMDAFSFTHFLYVYIVGRSIWFYNQFIWIKLENTR